MNPEGIYFVLLMVLENNGTYRMNIYIWKDEKL